MKTSLLAAGSVARHLCILFCFLPLAVWGADPAAPRQEVKLLTVGNSFADNSTAFLPQIAESAGKKLLLFRANLGGHSLDQHVGYLEAFENDANDPKGSPYKEKYVHEAKPTPAPVATAAPSVAPAGATVPKISLRKALESQPWDVVTIQQVSHKSYKPETYQPYADTLIAYIHKYAPNAKILIHETWAYGDDAIPAFNKKSGESITQQTMYDGLKAAYRKLSEETGLPMLPVGDAFQKARAQSIVVNLPANIHANASGEYLGGVIFFEMIYRDSADKVKFVPEKMTPEEAKTLRHIAQETVEEAAKSEPAKAAR